MKQNLLKGWWRQAAMMLALTLAGVQTVNAEQKTVWEGSEAISWNTEVAPGTQFETPESTFTGLAEGDIIRIYTTTTYDDPQYVVTYKAGDRWDWTDLSTTIAEGIISYTVESDEIATEIAERGLVLRGQAWTATKITIETPDEEVSNVLFTGEKATGNWSESVGISAATLKSLDAAEGDVIRVSVSTVQADAEVHLSNDWDGFDGVDGISIHPSALYADFAVTSSIHTVIDAGEGTIRVRGKNYTITKVELIPAADYYASLNLTDQHKNVHVAGTFSTVNITRSLFAGYNTITLPFAATAKELTGRGDAYLAELSGVSTEEGTVLTFTKVDATVANKPYLIYVPEGVEVQNQTDKTVAALVDDWHNQTWSGDFCMQGNYTPSLSVYQVNEKPCYVVSGADAIAPTASGATLDGMRAYLYDNGSSSVKNNIRFAIDDTETGIREMVAPEQVHGLIFNAAGQQMSRIQKGVNMVGGKTVLVK